MANEAGGRGGGNYKPRRPSATTSGQKPQPHGGAGKYNPRAALDTSQVRVTKRAFRKPPMK